jgi:hypothetical protein
VIDAPERLAYDGGVSRGGLRRTAGFLSECLAASMLAACAHRTVTVQSDPPGALVKLYPVGGQMTVTPGTLHGLRTGRSYTVRAVLKGYDASYAEIPPDPMFPWPFPINIAIQAFGGYDTSVELKLRPCTEQSGCLESEAERQQRPATY